MDLDDSDFSEAEESLNILDRDDETTGHRTTRDFDDLLLLNEIPSVGRRGILAQHFDLFALTDYQCKRYFRFHTAQDVERLRGLLRIPDTMRADNGNIASGVLYFIVS